MVKTNVNIFIFYFYKGEDFIEIKKEVKVCTKDYCCIVQDPYEFSIGYSVSDIVCTKPFKYQEE